MWILFALGSALFAGITAILAKIGIKNTDSNLATALRTVIVLAFSWLMVFVVGSFGTVRTISARNMLFLVLSGLATGASWICYFRALQLGTVNKVTPIDKSSTVLTMLLSFLFLGEAISFPMLAGMVLIGTGTFFMIQKKEEEKKEVKSRAWLVYAFLSAVFASLTAILGKVGVQGIDSTLGTAIRTVFVLIMAWVIVFMQKKQSLIKKIDKKSWIFIGLSGLTTGLSWLCYFKALQLGDVSKVAPIDKLSVAITIFLAVILLGEAPTLKTVLGGVCITAGSLILIL